MREPGSNNLGPDVLLQNVTISNATVTDLANVTDPVNGGTTSVELAATETGLNASTSQADVDVIGNALANTIATGSGDDTITGGLGADSLTGGDGDDTFKYVAGDGADTIVGGLGSDTLDYTGTASAVTVNLGAGTPNATGLASLTGIENVIGGSAGDTLDRQCRRQRPDRRRRQRYADRRGRSWTRPCSRRRSRSRTS